MKKSILYRSLFAGIVLLMWLASMFPLKDRNYFDYIRKIGGEYTEKIEISAKKAEDLEKEVSSTKKRYLNNRKNKILKNKYEKAKDDRYSVATKEEIEKFKDTVNQAEKKVLDNNKNGIILTNSQAIINTASERGIKLARFLPIHGYRLSNKAVARRISNKVEGQLKLGIDLSGGVEFIVAFDPKNLPKDNDAIEVRDSIIEILRNRIDYRGLADAEIRPYDDSAILIRVPKINAQATADIRSLISRPANLTFHKVTNNGYEVPKPDSTPAGYSWYPSSSNKLSGYILKKSPEMTGKNIINAFVSRDQNGSYAISKKFNTVGSKEFSDVTADNVGRPLAIVLDGVCYSAPNINERIDGGSAQITGDFTFEEANELAVVLKSGSLPINIAIRGESITSPTLGAQSINSGKYSALIGLIFIFIFMLFYYRLSGFIADIVLFANIILVFGSMTILQAAFTLPGIAGIILTIGMAVDSNILIFERIREEFAKGKVLRNAVRAGYDKAFITIFDANVTTLLTAVILYNCGSGPLKGFAVTLTVGIIASMFTSLFISRIFFDMIIAKGKIKSLKMLKIFSSPSIDFWSKRRFAIFTSLTLCILSLVVLFTKGKEIFSIDFTGGTSLTYQVNKKNSTAEEIGKKLSSAGFKGARVIFKENIALNSNTLEIIVKQDIEDFPQFDQSNFQDFLDFIGKKISDNKKDKFTLLSNNSIGGLVGNKFSNQAKWALFWSLIIIFSYISLRFESIFAIGAIIALVHDSIIAIGIYLTLGYQISLPVIAAILTVIGYSLNDTIVVFDRIRENSEEIKNKTVTQLMNLSINSTLSRTILTSLTTFIVVLVLVIFGGGGIQEFSIVLLIGIIVGTYSSVFIAAPIVCNNKLSKELENITARKKQQELANKNDQTVIQE